MCSSRRPPCCSVPVSSQQFSCRCMRNSRRLMYYVCILSRCWDENMMGLAYSPRKLSETSNSPNDSSYARPDTPPWGPATLHPGCPGPPRAFGEESIPPALPRLLRSRLASSSLAVYSSERSEAPPGWERVDWARYRLDCSVLQQETRPGSTT
jgi:hypothetical protein